MNTSKKKSAEKETAPFKDDTPKSKKPCRIDGKTVIWIDRDADEKEAIRKYLADKEYYQILYNPWKSNKGPTLL